MYLGRGPAVQAPLDGGQGREGRQSALADPFGEPGFGEHAGDVGMRPDDAGFGRFHCYLGGRDTAAQHRFRADVPALDGQAAENLDDSAEVGARVHQAGQGHIAGDAREAVPPRDGGHGVGPRMRATAQAAPKPLSIPTTTMPAAQLASMASSAVTPSKAAP